MPSTLTINNYSSGNVLETTQLDADVLAAATALTVVNNQNMSGNDFIVVGALGAEDGELKKITSVSGSTGITIPALANKHNRFDAVTKLFGDQITVYRAANVNGLQPADSAFAVFSGSLINIDTDQLSTLFTDSTGSSDYWYKFVYTNSVTSASTPLADSTAARGQGYSNYCSLDDVRQEAGFAKARYITDAMIDTKRQAAQDEVNSALGGYYAVPFTVPVNAFISDITCRLAAGLLLLGQFGAFDTLNTQDGKAKVDGARADIARLQSGNLILKDETGSSIAVAGAGGFNAWPNGTTVNADPSVGGDNGALVRISDRY